MTIARTDHPRLAAILFEPREPVDEAVVQALAPHGGRRVLGWLQTHETGTRCDCSEIVLVALHDGTRRRITQDLGRDARGCRLDSAALAEVAGWLAADLAAGLQSGLDGSLASGRPELLVLNRFGKIEASGGGLRAVLEAALAEDVPALVPVSRRQLDLWHDYAGDLAVELPCNAAAIGDWIGAVLAPLQPDMPAQPASTMKIVASPSRV